ncbi:MAG: pilus assembly protein [Chloroflexi bacterium]|nr:pilus assembly protein [Chloroflexota bacterium]
MVEFAILLPILLMLFSGMVEFGFMLNTYLSILDATRQAARQFSNTTPFLLDTATNTIKDNPAFYEECAQAAVINLDPSLATPSDPNARRIVMNPNTDDVIVSVLSVSVNSAVTPAVISSIERHPVGLDFYSLYGQRDTKYSNANIEEYMTQNNRTPVETGILIVEIYYGYSGILKLPWVTAFMSAADPVILHASTIMPLVAAKP